MKQPERSSFNAVPQARTRLRLSVRGRVQGVGFRPYVYRLAVDLGLSGLVGNDTHGAFIEIEGPREAVERFTKRLPAELPPLARIVEVQVETIPVQSSQQFRIDRSETTGLQDAEITPDVATCADCLAELADPKDRRFRYPFINCTNCGPRYTIIRSVPYDRPNTTMARFTMCPACRREYDDPADRRFHAQPNACPVCGPRVWLADRQGRELSGDPIVEAARWLREGRILAIKGILWLSWRPAWRRPGPWRSWILMPRPCSPSPKDLFCCCPAARRPGSAGTSPRSSTSSGSCCLTRRCIRCCSQRVWTSS